MDNGVRIMKKFKKHLLGLEEMYKKQLIENRENLSNIHPLDFESLNSIPLKIITLKSKLELITHLIVKIDE